MLDIGVDVFVITFASFTIITASLIALSKDNLKARLAFSTISQLSYIILGAVFAYAKCDGGRYNSYYEPCLFKDYPFFLRWFNLCLIP
ncbi:MAG: hypothetical protein CM1200mP10_00130 [Candidatus Neomarinimicrobiota bacterium]|nr:MAG: hypothetical protein CM1200mP10_00130 [Candidatus Neomarinimicrobiota bacterium]